MRRKAKRPLVRGCKRERVGNKSQGEKKVGEGTGVEQESYGGGRREKHLDKKGNYSFSFFFVREI